MSDQRTVLVTGANSDIGAELCHYFLDNGDNVIAMVNIILDDSYNTSADINQNGIVDVVDIIAIINIILE